MTAGMHRLISLPFSHYVEKARWALDRSGIDYREERYMPGFSMAAVAWATWGRGGRSDRVSSRFSVPVLLLGDGRILTSSGDIARFADHEAELGWYRDPRAAELEARFHDRLGPHTRRVAYDLAFDDDSVLDDLARRNVPARQAALFHWLAPVVEQLVTRGLAVTPERASRSLERIRKELDEVGTLLQDGRPYLLGDRFSAADLTFACMLVPVLQPSRAEGFGADLSPMSELHARAVELVTEVREHPAGAFALRLFAQDR